MNESHENEDTLTAYLDGELDAVAARRVDAHLVGCAACRATLAAWREADAALAAVAPARSEAEWEALAQRVDRTIGEEEARDARIREAAARAPESKPPGRRRFLWVWSSGAVAAAALVLLMRPWVDEPPPSSSSRPTSEAAPEKERAALELPRATTPSDAARQDAAPDARARSVEPGESLSKAKDSATSPAPIAGNAAPSAPPPASFEGDAGAGGAREESQAKITPEPSGALLMRSDVDRAQRSTRSIAGTESMKSTAEKPVVEMVDKPEGTLQESVVTPPTQADLEKSLGEVDAALRDPSALLKVPELLRRRMQIAAQLAAFDRERWCETARAARADWLRDGAVDSTSVREAAWIEERCGER